jgi:hypothetical protein
VLTLLQARVLDVRFSPVPVNNANDLNALSGVFHLRIFCLRRTEGLTVVAGRVETTNLLLAGCKHIAGITHSFLPGAISM